jgi:hypothetical protein
MSELDELKYIALQVQEIKHDVRSLRNNGIDFGLLVIIGLLGAILWRVW